MKTKTKVMSHRGYRKFKALLPLRRQYRAPRDELTGSAGTRQRSRPGTPRVESLAPQERTPAREVPGLRGRWGMVAPVYGAGPESTRPSSMYSTSGPTMACWSCPARIGYVIPNALTAAVMGSEKNTGSTRSTMSPATSRKWRLFSSGIRARRAPLSMPTCRGSAKERTALMFP